ncbi:MAG: hypothetical protein A2513_09610 [Sulfurimonas sp. RIFOXYD12_FULL_33_39]|uniref:type II toxin-antitoxin system RelE/ParE family toxin n=1 Tax=unclassified Sulfurimonas TaxID=2623549 RepID=UPI0008B30989|nr:MULTISPECIES: type II toxin-antitoxin system RelE/ParE family toxin [unclassified Sulfurimonas]OHE10702.1 MAG: hypothetical protein A2513_09610 [Sulfurimonas sp. RIFOXYD12_FULL_33_39]OHE13215.1 MAG: hypothetical protein A2530_11200 [Sulfurimonas sp. RIFOXYD2_FULL_34_21]
MYSIKYTELAKQDLFELFEKIAQDKPTVAVEYINKLEKHIELLEENPLLGIECKNKNIKKDCRILIYEYYLLFYKFKNNEVLIIRVINSKVNYKKQL